MKNTNEIQSGLTMLKMLNAELKKLKKIEMDLRVKLVNMINIDYPKTNGEGTHKIEFDDFDIKLKTSYNYRLDQVALTHIEEDLSDYEKSCIRYKAELSLSQYKKSDKHELLDTVVTATLAAPSIEFIEIEE